MLVLMCEGMYRSGTIRYIIINELYFIFINSTFRCELKYGELQFLWRDSTVTVSDVQLFLKSSTQKYFTIQVVTFCLILIPSARCNSALNIKLLEPLAQGASRFEKLLAPRKIYWPPFPPTDVYIRD